MQLTSGILTSLNQQVTSSTNANLVVAGSTLSVTLTTMGFDTGDKIYWAATGTSVNSTGSAIVTNSFGIIGSASFSISTSFVDTGTFNVFLLNTQLNGSTFKTIPIFVSAAMGTYGWFAGGEAAGPYLSSIVRIDFSNDSPVSASPRSSLPVDRTQAGATGNTNYGWIGGGAVPGFATSSVQRLSYATDTAATTSRGPLSAARYFLNATGNTDYGWFISGTTPVIDRIDYASDTAAASPRSPAISLGQSKGAAATGNADYGWFGGAGGPAGAKSSVYRITYSNDTTTPSQRGPITGGGYNAAVSNSNYGWWGGGYSQNTKIDRVDFSNDTPGATTRAVLSQWRLQLSGTGNNNYGWFGGGGTAYPNARSIVDRIDYSNDSAAISVRGTLGSNRQGQAATSNYVK